MQAESGAGSLSAILRGLLWEVRPWQWYKQGVMLFGIVFSRNLGNAGAWFDLLLGIAAFTAVVGGVYIFNDISDLEADRSHPEKRNRPIASGQVPVRVGAVVGAVILLGGLALSLRLDPLFLAVVAAYLVQNVLYSLYLKELVLIDVILVAVGFVLRAIAGVVVIDVFLSPWLIVCTFLLALVLALGKRRHELELVDDPEAVRGVLGEYSLRTVDDMQTVATATLLMAYSLYTFFRADPTMMLTLPFAFFGVFRYHHLVRTADVAGNPEYILTDVPSLLNLVLWGLVALGVLYELPEYLVGVVT